MSDLKKSKRGEPDPFAADLMPGVAMLRALAGYPRKAVHLGKHRVESRIVHIQRDQFGNVVGSTERLEFSEYTDLDGDFID